MCKICGNIFKYSQNTTNLRDHLKRKHPEININKSLMKIHATKKKEIKVDKLTEFIKRNKNYEEDSIRNRNLDMK